MTLALSVSLLGVGPFVALVGAPPAPVSAQNTLRLGPARYTVAEPFNMIRRVRELQDGRVLVVDRGARAVFLVDPKDGSIRQVGRQGEGPSEYRAPVEIVPLGGDSSLLVDASLRRWHILDGERIVNTMSWSARVLRMLGPDVVGADALGAVVAAVQPEAYLNLRPGERRALVRGRFANPRIDTLAMLALTSAPVARVERMGIMYYLENPLATEEQAVHFVDGWTAVARVDPYRVEWIDPRGRLTAGMTVKEEAVSANEAERNAAIARRWFVPGYKGPRWSAADFKGWPESVPAFERDAVLAGPGGVLLVRRTPTLQSAGQVYDIFHRTGGRVSRLVLGKGQRVVGAGRGAIFVVEHDADGLELLTAHTWPPS